MARCRLSIPSWRGPPGLVGGESVSKIMSDPQNAAVLALLSVLEQRAKKKGRKSLVKDVLRVLSEKGASDDLIAEIVTLSPAKNTNGQAEPKKAASEHRRNGKTPAKAARQAGPKTGAKKKAKADAGLAA